ncbi:coiled-coil domain-containing protein 57 isoform X4 [Mugil cephalus]|uniref:coiled-coil domain-containing protein 57 isoform X4 n=1 Tax=Mugil cephalus TaxID=48193 RepID=UPI001FB65667|nr:coiled-coil domain-containing protein 57 isoform X4 [Mugil cephalus]
MVFCRSTMHSDGDSGLRDLEAKLASKERELKELQAVKIQQLESSLKKTQEECSSLREHYQQLREDFQFNLAILDERDRELQRYDVMTARALTEKQHRQAELRQLHMQIAKLEEQIARGARERQEDLQKNHHNAFQQRRQLDELKRSMAEEIQSQMEEYDRMKLDLQCRIKDLERELAQQRQEMTSAFDSELIQREHEFNLKMDEMHALVLSNDIKVELLSKESEVHCQAQLQATEALNESREVCKQIQAQLQHKDQEIKNVVAVKDERIKELEDELKQIETQLKEENDEHIKKYGDVVRALKKRDAQLETQHQRHKEQLQKAEEHIVNLRRNMEDQQKAMQRKDETIQRLHTGAEAIRTDWDKFIKQASSEMVVKDTEIITLQERETKLTTELERSREQIERYKQQVSAGLERERALEQRGVQMELECQRRCEDMKAEHYLASEQLIQDLTQARDQAKAELKEKEQELRDVTVLLRSVRTERDQAIQGLTPKVDSLASEEIHRLQEQNHTLRAVVSQMRKEMEGLSHNQLHHRTGTQASSALAVQHPGSSPTTSITPSAHAQMASEPQAQCTDISKVSPEGGLCQEVNTSALIKQVRGTQTEPVPASVTEQSALVRQLLEENLFLQQRASGLMLGAVRENIPRAKSNAPLLHTRLKKAVSCIARLSRDKQQLIEMCNCLRAQISTVGPQEPVEPVRDPSTEKPEDQHDRLSVLEQLQYQLTTQELQYALKQRAGPVSTQPVPGTSNQGPSTKGSVNTPRGHKAISSSESSSYKENTRPLSQTQTQPLSALSLPRLSSEESLRSLKELWEILDNGLSQSIFSEGEGELSRKELAASGGSGVQMMVCGSGFTHNQPSTEVQQRSNNSKTPSSSTKTSRPAVRGRMNKIRNYNVKD